MDNGPVRPVRIEIDRDELARVMNTWATHIANLLQPWVATDPGAARKHIRGCNRSFVTAVSGETSNRFLQDHAVELAKALEEALIAKSIDAHVRGVTDAERKKAQKSIAVRKPAREVIRARPPKDVDD